MFKNKNKSESEEIKNDKSDQKEHIKYKSPEILMIDCNKEESDKLIKKGFNIELGSFGKKYKLTNQYGNKKIALNDEINNIVEKDIIIIDMKQRSTDELYELIDVSNLEEGVYLTTYKNQKEFNPINIASSIYKEQFIKLKDKDSIFIVIADKEVKEKYNMYTLEHGYCRNQDMYKSNYDFLPFNINCENNNFETQKFQIVADGIFKDIFKNYNGKIYSQCTFEISSYQKKNTARLLENMYGDLIGYYQMFEGDNNNKNTLIVLPQCENVSIIIENIITGILPMFYPEIFADFIKDTWMDKEEYMLPAVKNILKEKEKLTEEFNNKISEIDKKIKEEKDKNEFLYNIISSTGTGDKLVQNIIKCLNYIGYEKVEDWDKVRDDNDKEEDLHIYISNKEYYIAEVKGINGPATEDDCNAIVRYKSRNCSKLNISSIHGAVFVNYHKNVEPNKREELGFTKKEIKDAERDKYTLVGTYQLFKAIRLYQEKIITKEEIRNSLETPGLFKAIPSSFENIGKIENLLDKINVICVSIQCSNLKVGDELLIIEDNDYYKTKILSMMMNDKDINESVKGDSIGIKIDKNIPKNKSAQIYLIK